MDKGLKSISFFNTGRFAYGTVALDGNTLLTGTNGAGKTTTNQSVLFFYGNNRRERLGISKADGKLAWPKYMYPNTNSYVFYRYTGIYGDVLLMTYPYSLGTAWRFITIDSEPDLAAIVLENNVPRNPNDVINAFILAGYKASSQVTEPRLFKRILYGDIDFRREKDLVQFREYALMEAPGDYHHIPDMQSSIFINSKIGSGAIERAITSGYGMKSSLPLSQIRGQLKDVTEQFEAVQVYTKRGEDIRKMDTAARSFHDGTKQVEALLRQILANKRWWRSEIDSLSLSLDKAKNDQLLAMEAFEQEIILQDAEYRKILTDETEARIKLKAAEDKQGRYADIDMNSIAAEVDLLPTLTKEKEQKKTEYDNSLGGAKTIAETYDDLLKAERDGLAEQIRANEGNFELRKGVYSQQKEDISTQYEKDILGLDEQYELQYAKLKSKLLQSETSKNEAFKIKAVTDSVNPYLDEVNRLSSAVADTKGLIESAKKEASSFTSQVNILIKRRDDIEQHIESVSADATRRMEVERKPYDEEIRVLNEKLEASKESVLGLIRNYLPEMEQTLASLLKDDILLSTEMSPMVVEIQPSAYGLMFDTENLPRSEISKEAILAKISSIGKSVISMQKLISDEIDSRVAVMNKEKSEVLKDIYSAKVKKDEVDNGLARNSSKLFSIEEELIAAKAESESKWLTDKATAATVFESAESLYRSLKQEEETASAKLRDEKVVLKGLLKTKIDAIAKAVERMRAELEEANNMARLQSNKAYGIIEIRRDEALKEGGYSPEKISSLKNEAEISAQRHMNAIKNAGLVSSWRSDRHEIDAIPIMKKQYEQLSEAVVIISDKNKKRTAEIDAEKNRASTRIMDMSSKINNYQMQIQDAENAWRRYELQSIVLKISEEGDNAILPSQINESAAALANNAIIANEKRFEYGRIASAGLQKFLSHIPDRERFTFFNCDLSTTENAVHSIANLIEFVESGGLDEIKETIASEIRLIQGNLSVQYENFNSETKSIEVLVQRIDKGLKRAIEKIPVIDEIGIRVIRNEHRIFRDLEAISSVDIPYGDTRSLFADLQKSGKSSSEILDHFDKLFKHLDDEKADELTIADTIEVQFKITENGNTSDWSSSKGNIGSTGTSVIVKTLTYVSLLNAVIELTQRGERVPVHVMLDEIGTLDQNNMRQIVDFANENGIYFLNAAPDIKIPDRYKNMYIYQLSGGKSKISRLAVRG